MTDRLDVAVPGTEPSGPAAATGATATTTATATDAVAAVDAVAEVARAVLYEGYLLWPYRASALKNSRRWTLGGVHPRACAATGDSSVMRTQVLVETGAGDGAGGSAGDRAADRAGDTVDVRVCFLHAVTLEVGRLTGDGLVPAGELTVAGRRYLAREEATERCVAANGLDLDELTRRPAVLDIDVPEGRQVEWLTEPGGACAGALTRSWCGLRGRVEIRAERLAAGGPGRSGLLRLTVEVANTTDWAGGSRTEAMRRTFASAHTILHSPGGRFVSLTDPPERLRREAQDCENVGTWPVLAGPEGDRHTVLSSPIILYDHPRIAPESPGDLFDATEIDQLLTLSTLCLTEEEQREIRDGDPKAAEILDRCASLPPERLMRLHGAVREFRPIGGPGT